MKKILLLSFHHAQASVEEREKWVIPRDQWPSLLAALRDEGGAAESVYLGTCNRVEVYAVVDADFDWRRIMEVWRRFCPKVSAETVPTLILEQEKAIEHLFRVAASLDSMVVGETEILGQVKTAYQAALAYKATGPWLNRVFQQALASAKKVRTQTGLGEKPVSISTVAVKLAAKIFGTLESTRALVVGTGEMGTQTARYFVKRGIGELWLTNRTESTARELAQTLRGKVVPFETWQTGLSEIDIIVSCTAAPRPPIQQSLIEPFVCRRQRGPLFLIDLGVPRDVEATVGELEGVFLYNMDDLKTIADQNRVHRLKKADTADGLITEATSQVFHKLITPVLT